MEELRFEELTLEQKAGLCLCAYLNKGEEDVEYALEMIRKHSLGAIWMQPEIADSDDIIRRVHEAADYPILVMCDAENGAYPYKIPSPISITASGAKSEYARSFGRVTAAFLRKKGYNTICNPLLDIQHGNVPCGGTNRTFGSDKDTVSRLGAEVARGMHEAGVLTVAKHYPGATGLPYDSHMRETYVPATREELLDDALVPYLKLMKQGLLDGIMTGHKRVPSIDPEYPASLSKDVLDVLRSEGYNGFYITDALCMLGIRLRYGYTKAHGLSIRAGNSFALSWDLPVKDAYDCMKRSLEEHIISEADIDAAVQHTLQAQHKLTMLRSLSSVPEDDIENIRRINRECIASVCAPGFEAAISMHGKHLFVITTNGYVNETRGTDPLGTLYEWYDPDKIAAKLKSLFTNSDVYFIPCYPSPGDMWKFFRIQGQYEDLVFVTYFQSGACVGREHLTYPLIDLMDALQSTDRIAAQLHFGNPFVLEDTPFVPRCIFGLASAQCVENAIDVLAGEGNAMGQIPYLLKLRKKGDIFHP